MSRLPQDLDLDPQEENFGRILEFCSGGNLAAAAGFCSCCDVGLISRNPQFFFWVGGIVAPMRDQKWAFAVKISGEVHKGACRRYIVLHFTSTQSVLAWAGA
jgi:hypothetical protein